MDGLNDRVDAVYAARGGALLRDPWAARDAYIDVVLHPAAADSFLDAQCSRSLSADERVQALRLLEMQRHRLLASTSCGWFFADLAGIEAVQILRYAARAIELAEGIGEHGIESSFSDQLAEAKSNNLTYGDGRSVYEHLARAAALHPLRAVREHVVAALFDREAPPPAALAAGISVADLERTERRTADSHLIVGRARARVRRTHETVDVAYAGIRGRSGVPHIGAALEISSIPADAARDIVARFDAEGAAAAMRTIADDFPAPVQLEEILSSRDLANLESAAAAAALESVEDGGATLAVLGDPRIAHSGALRGLALFALHRRLAELARTLDAMDVMEKLLEQARAASLPVSGSILAHDLGRSVARSLAEASPDKLTPDLTRVLIHAVSRARALAPDVNLWRAQETYLEVVRPRREGPMRADLEALGAALGVRLPVPAVESR
jgi:hypothetical protein